MARSLPIAADFDIDSLQIATPCDMDWEDMRGDDQKRHCDACNMNVYNFAGMTRPEIRTLLNEAEGRVCSRMFRRADGTVLTRDCPVGLAEKAWRHARNGTLAMAASVLTVVAFVIGALAFLSRPTCTVVEPATSVIQLRDKLVEPEPMIMGEMAMPEPVEMGKIAPSEYVEIKGDIALPLD
jgi:hypothetical protein